jgi:tRNA dimethylallyltransferase
LIRRPVIVIGGPTASGKSSLALEIAEEFGGEVVNADSMQVYGDLEILTARPGADETRRVPHHLYGVLGVGERCSAGQWRTRALDAIRDIHSRARVPVVVGGTGLYLRALVTGLHRMPTVPTAIREDLNARLAAEGARSLHAELTACDPESAAGLNPSDAQRVVRALEIFIHTGQGLKSWQSGETEAAPDDLRFFRLVTLPPRDALYDAVNERFGQMISQGALEEVERLFSQAPEDDFPLLKAVGVQAIRSYLAGEIDRERLLELGRRDTRRYAKRQMTWFRRQIIPEMTIETKYSEINLPKIFSKISRFLLTE